MKRVQDIKDGVQSARHKEQDSGAMVRRAGAIQILVSMLFLIHLFFACNNSEKKEKEVKVAGTDSDTQPVDSSLISQKDTVPQNIQIDSVIHLSFAPGTNAVSVKGHLDKRGDPVICYLPVVQGKKLTASLSAENKKATIRFSHLFLPDGRSDGPFGQTLNYKIRQQGLYKIYIGPNKMAGDPASTDFVLTVKVE